MIWTWFSLTDILILKVLLVTATTVCWWVSFSKSTALGPDTIHFRFRFSFRPKVQPWLRPKAVKFLLSTHQLSESPFQKEALGRGYRLYHTRSSIRFSRISTEFAKTSFTCTIHLKFWTTDPLTSDFLTPSPPWNAVLNCTYLNSFRTSLPPSFPSDCLLLRFSRATTLSHNITCSFNGGCHTQPYKTELTVKLKVGLSIALIYAMLVWVCIQHTDYEIGIV